MKKIDDLEWSPKNWWADTRHLSSSAKGIYMDLLMVLWMQFQPTLSIPNDDFFIAKQLGITRSKWLRAKAEIMNEKRSLLVPKDDRFLNKGLVKAYEKMTNLNEINSVNGRKGAEMRWRGHSRATSEEMAPPFSPFSDDKSSLSIYNNNIYNTLLSKKDGENSPAIDRQENDTPKLNGKSPVDNSKKTDPEIKKVIDHFFKAFGKFNPGKVWHVDGKKVGGMVKKLLSTFKTAQAVNDLIDDFFLAEDEYLDKVGRDFNIFCSQVNKLQTKKGGHNGSYSNGRPGRGSTVAGDAGGRKQWSKGW